MNKIKSPIKKILINFIYFARVNVYIYRYHLVLVPSLILLFSHTPHPWACKQNTLTTSPQSQIATTIRTCFNRSVVHMSASLSKEPQTFHILRHITRQANFSVHLFSNLRIRKPFQPVHIIHQINFKLIVKRWLYVNYRSLYPQ